MLQRMLRKLVPILAATQLVAAAGQAAIEACGETLTPSNPTNTIVELQTSLGSICIELYEDQAPLNAANFLYYLQNGDIDGTFFHDADPSQERVFAGLFYVDGVVMTPVVETTAVDDEPCTLDIPGDPPSCSVRGNVRGSIGTEKASGQPNSGSTRWYVNLVDNRVNHEPPLDSADGGYSVFAQILNASGLSIVDQIAAAPLYPTHEVYYSLAAEPLWFLMFLKNLPVLQVPTSSPGEFGCFEIDSLSTVASMLDPLLPVILFGTPFEYFRPFLASGTCGTELEDPADFVATPIDDPSCPFENFDTTKLGGGVARDYVNAAEWVDEFGEPAAGPSRHFSFTCADAVESLDRTAERRGTLGARIADQLIYVEQALIVPEPGRDLLATLAVLSLAGLRARHRNRR